MSSVEYLKLKTDNKLAEWEGRVSLDEIPKSKADFMVKYLDLPMAAEIEDAEWEDFQLEFLDTKARGRIDNKGRQIGWSFACAADAVADGILNPGNPHIFVSINKDESQEKIRFVKNIWEALQINWKPEIIKDSMTSVEFSNGSRFISHPARPPRGKAKARIYLDEMAHYATGYDKAIYKGATPAMIKGDGYIRIGSSPLGASGLFWEMETETMKKYPGFVRGSFPWWTIKALCKDVTHAKGDPESMSTQERVDTYANETLLWQFDNNFIEDFQQEFECDFVDESTAWITWETIKANQNPDLVCWHAKSIDQALSMLDEVILAHRDSKIERTLAGGMDIGRTRDLTELMILGNGEDKQKPIRFMVSLYNEKLDAQEDCFRTIFERLPLTKVLIDQSGLGRQLAESLQGNTVGLGVDFTSETKELWANGARIEAERYRTPLPVDRELAYQIHSIKRTMTATKYSRFDNDRNTDKHHADKFWAWALAIDACTKGGISYNQLEQLGKVKGYGERWK